MAKLVGREFDTGLIPKCLGDLTPQARPILGVHFATWKEIGICTLCVECTPIADVGLYPLAHSERKLEDQIDIILHLRTWDVNNRMLVLP